MTWDKSAGGWATGCRGIGGSQALKVCHEYRVLAAEILQALEIFLKDRVGGIADAVDHPVGAPLTFHQVMAFKVGQVLGNLDLGFSQYLLDMADTERILNEQVKDPQAGEITQASVYLAKVLGIHVLYIPLKEYTCKGI